MLRSVGLPQCNHQPLGNAALRFQRIISGIRGVVFTLFLRIFDSAPISRWELFLTHSTTQTHTHTQHIFLQIPPGSFQGFSWRARGQGIQPWWQKKAAPLCCGWVLLGLKQGPGGAPASGLEPKGVPAGHAELPLHPWQIYTTSSRRDLGERLDRNPPPLPSPGMRGWNAIGLGQAPFPNPSIHPFDHKQTAGHRAGRSSR